MKWSQAVRMSLTSILENKLRSFLTMLGIIIGVLSVTLLVSIVQGVSDVLTSELSDVGGATLYVTVGSTKNNHLTLDDLKELEQEKSVARVSPSVAGITVVRYDNESYDKTTVAGITDKYRSLIVLESGRPISSEDVDQHYYVTVISNKIALELFGRTDVVGNSISMLGRSFEIIGVNRPEPENSQTAMTDTVFIPYTTAARLLRIPSVTSFEVVSNRQEATMTQTEEVVEAFMQKHIPHSSLKDGEEKGYSVLNMGEIVSVLETVSSVLSSVLGGIAAISLVVGGIGIMNIMLVSVTERTKEIGIRKAIGAQYKDIMFQFLVESITISVAGGLIGMLLGLLGMKLFSMALEYDIPLSPSVAIMALSVSLVIGVFFGLFPASRAAKLKPVDALRYG